MEKTEKVEKVSNAGSDRFIGSPSTVSTSGAVSDVEPDDAAGPHGLLYKGALPVDGSRNLHSNSPGGLIWEEVVCIVLFFQVGTGDVAEVQGEWPAGLHHLQLWFGVTDFLVAAPVSLSGVILDAPEATTILSGCSFFVWQAFTAPNTAAVAPNTSVRVEFTMRLTYQAPMIGYDYQDKGGPSSVAEAKPDYDGESPNEPSWDEDLPWADWHCVDNPVRGFELIAIWNKRFVNDSVEMSEYENTSTFDADEWEPDQPEEGFAVRREGLANAFQVAGNAQFLEDFANVVKPEMDLLLETFTMPPPSVPERVLKDLFYEAVTPTDDGFTYKPRGHSIKGAPRDSLFGRFAMHSLFFGTCNIRAISELWLEFVREIRWCWDECQALPRVSPDESPDLRTYLLHQKLQMLRGKSVPESKIFKEL